MDLWYNSFEHTMFKSKVAIVCARITRDESGINNNNRNKNGLSYQRIVQSIFDECCRCTSEDDADLLPEQHDDWTMQLRRYPNRLGLEKYIVQNIAAYQYERQQRMVEMVVLIHSIETENNNTPENKDEIVRKACANASLPSRLFARFTAQATAATEDDSAAIAAAAEPIMDLQPWPRALLDDEEVL